jgi:hypothetical protein
MLGVLSAGFGGIAAVASTDHEGVVAAMFLTLSALSGAGTLLAAVRGSSAARLAESMRRREKMLQILDLARTHQGRLNVTLVASHLHLDFRESEAALDAMVDGRRVDLEVDDEGRVTYVFSELLESSSAS